MSIFHSESALDCAELDKAELFVQMPRMDVCRHDRIELHNPESCEPGLRKAVLYKKFPDMKSAAGGAYGITCVCNVRASADVVRVQNVKPDDFSAFSFLCDRAVSLRRKKIRSVFLSQSFFLGKGNSILYNFIPNPAHRRKVFFRVFSDDYFIHDFFLARNYSGQKNRGQDFLSRNILLIK